MRSLVVNAAVMSELADTGEGELDADIVVLELTCIGEGGLPADVVVSELAGTGEGGLGADVVVSELTCIGEGGLAIEATEYVLVSAAVTPGTSSPVTAGIFKISISKIYFSFNLISFVFAKDMAVSPICKYTTSIYMIYIYYSNS